MSCWGSNRPRRIGEPCFTYWWKRPGRAWSTVEGGDDMVGKRWEQRWKLSKQQWYRRHGQNKKSELCNQVSDTSLLHCLSWSSCWSTRSWIAHKLRSWKPWISYHPCICSLVTIICSFASRAHAMRWVPAFSLVVLLLVAGSKTTHYTTNSCKCAADCNGC